jgi:hypothetical protein
VETGKTWETKNRKRNESEELSEGKIKRETRKKELGSKGNLYKELENTFTGRQRTWRQGNGDRINKKKREGEKSGQGVRLRKKKE